ncbi:MAG: NAD(P)H-dependent oxidoreductase [Microscillaceae bacterium]|jgi:NAD(P)H-dependent FMN reductase|nr:NAD(P)H-dependent oxidoreductase [Microscillaceae bacterium]
MITIISCTNRKNALTKKVCQYYQSLLNGYQIESQILDLNLLPPDFSFSALYENAGKNPQFNEFQAVIDQNEKFVLVVPEYNGSFPGVIKTFIDGLRYPNSFQNKKIALVSLSSGVQGGALAVSHLTDIFHYLNAEVLSIKVKLPKVREIFKDGVVIDDFINDLLHQQIKKFMQF